MENCCKARAKSAVFLFQVLCAIILFVFAATAQASFTIGVTGKDVESGGSQTLNDYKWLVQEDNTYDAPGHVGIYNNYSSISVSIHKSSAKVLATGTGANPVVNLPANGRYFVSVLAPGYSLTGTTVRPNQTTANVIVYKNPIRTAQISALIFHDNAPINGAPDAEDPLSRFKIVLYDQFGQQSQDAFGNPLGTIYNPDGSVKYMGDGNIISSPVIGRVVLPSSAPLPAGGIVMDGLNLSAPIPGFVGNVLIQNIAPGKYGVRAIALDGRPWVQTSTIEGTPGIDNWVRAGEPTYYTEAGFFGVHTFIGFVLPSSYVNTLPSSDPLSADRFSYLPGPPPANVGTVAGQVVQNRINRPPQQMGLNPGEPVPEAYVGLTEIGATQRQVFVIGCTGTAPASGSYCDANANFRIEGIPPGTYTLTMWDKPLDQIIDFRTVTIPATALPTDPPITLGTVSAADPQGLKIPIFQWFGTYEGSFYVDRNLNGIRDPGEEGIPNMAVGFRFRDGSPYLGTVTDTMGNFTFTEVFPWFKWIIAESDYSRFYPTGANVFVDKGGSTLFDINNPASLLENKQYSIGPDTAGPDTLLMGMLLYFGETAHIDWGRAPYPVTIPGTTTTITNGGVSGVISYAFTRASGDPSKGAQSTWEPGQGNVTLNLYKVTGFDPVTGKPKFDPPYDKPIATTLSDSWDRFVFDEKNAKTDVVNKGLHPDTGLLTGCLDAMQNAGLSLTPQGIPLDKYIDCAETMSVWNQIKPAVYDGGYIFTTFTDPVDGQEKPLPSGQYVVEVVPPVGYEVVKEEDQNFVASGDTYLPSKIQPAALPPACVGPDHIVPPFLTFDGTSPAPYAGQARPLCNMKLVNLQDGQNAPADFRIFTQVPLAARIIGLITDDLALEFRPGNPRLGDKPGPSFMPISIQDFNGHELVRTYTDEWGIYNALVPSTYTTNVPNPTGVSPTIVKLVLNHPGSDPANPDPWYNPNYPTAEWQIDTWPGKITYADTPIVPIRPNIGANDLDCNMPDGTPVIKMANGPAGGPWVETPANPAANTVTFTAMGLTSIKNPDPNVGGMITRDYGFGNVTGTVMLNGTSLPIVSWSSTSIVATVPAGSVTGQVTISRGDNSKSSRTGITLHVGVPAANVRQVAAGQSIQAAINAASAGDLILIAPGVYAENLIMNKPVQLQGYGAYSTTINAGFFTPEKKAAWDTLLASIFGTAGANKTYSPDPTNTPTPIFTQDDGAGILVLGRHDTSGDPVPEVPSVFTNDDFTLNQSRIDGLSITGANLGGGIYVFGYAHSLQITNDKIFSNQGTYGGGIRLGSPGITNGTIYQSSFNDNITVSHNEIIANGGVGLAIGSGGGIGIFEGTDNYLISDSWVCGNYAALAGAGIMQQGLSSADPTKPGVIQNNTIIFNEAFDEGAGIFLGGETPINAATPNAVTPGVGNVIIRNNLIQGNKAGNLGGGIALLRYNGDDVAVNPTDPTQWYKAKIYNNMIVNNITAGYGGGVALFDAVNTDIAWNTIANNDSTATGELAFGNVPFVEGPAALINKITTPMPAGIGVQPVSAALLANMDATVRPGYVDYTASPLLVNNVIAGNFSYYWANQSFNQIATLTPFGYWDLGIFGSTTGQLHPTYTLLTDTTLAPKVEVLQIATDPSNLSADPRFVKPYRNTISAFQGGAALGNFITYSYSPMSLSGNYHIAGTSPAVSKATASPAGVDGVDLGPGGLLTTDYDNDPRPIMPLKIPDMGADEYNSKGDVNNDGVINILDVLSALQQLALLPAQRDAAIVAAADVAPLLNGRPVGNGVFDIADVLLLLQRAVGVVVW